MMNIIFARNDSKENPSGWELFISKTRSIGYAMSHLLYCRGVPSSKRPNFSFPIKVNLLIRAPPRAHISGNTKMANSYKERNEAQDKSSY